MGTETMSTLRKLDTLQDAAAHFLHHIASEQPHLANHPRFERLRNATIQAQSHIVRLERETGKPK